LNCGLGTSIVSLFVMLPWLYSNTIIIGRNMLPHPAEFVDLRQNRVCMGCTHLGLCDLGVADRRCCMHDRTNSGTAEEAACRAYKLDVSYHGRAVSVRVIWVCPSLDLYTSDYRCLRISSVFFGHMSLYFPGTSHWINVGVIIISMT
jgi:hypothetical protein